MTTAKINQEFNNSGVSEFYGLFCEGVNVSESPLIDDVTKLVTSALRIAKPGERYRSWHTTPMGKESSNCNYFISVKMHQFDETITKLEMNSLAIYYAAYCRGEFDSNDWAFIDQLQKLGLGLSEPTVEELDGDPDNDTLENFSSVVFDLWSRDEFE